MTWSNHKGFTLIEVLIVVVVIAVLASLILPRMLSQPENANLAEAYTRIGAITRAQERYADFDGATPLVFTCANPPANCGANAGAATALQSLGLADFPQKNFRYQCASSTGNIYCLAYRWIGGVATAYIYQWASHTSTANLGRWMCNGAATPGKYYVGQISGTTGLQPTGQVCRADF